MKTILKLIALIFVLSSLSVFAQEFEPDDEPTYNPEEFSPAEELATSEGTANLERQEEPIFPEGEENSWSLGSEDLPAEEFE